MGDDTLWVSTMPSLHRLRKRPPLVDRVPWLEASARDASVAHLGFVDAARGEDKRESGTWLHERLARSAARLIGIDDDSDGVERARRAGFEAYRCDLQDVDAVSALGLRPAELAIAGELIEHLDCPGRFLDAVRSLVVDGGRLILTTPNATSLTNLVVAVSRREWSSPHHVGMYSWRTLSSLLGRHGWEAQEILFYYRGRRVGAEAAARPGLAAAFNSYERVTRPVLRRLPAIADGLIVVARKPPT